MFSIAKRRGAFQTNKQKEAEQEVEK